MKKWINWLIFSAVGIILALGAFMFNLWALPMMVDYQVGKTMGLENGSFAWDTFVDTPVPLYMKVYFFNVENPEGIARGEKPKVKEVGPYVYRETKKKHDLKINYKTDTVFYNQGSTFTFDAEKSHPLTEDDEVNLINFAIHLISQIVDSIEYPINLINEIVELGLPQMLPGKYGITLPIKVKEILFDGLIFNCTQSNATVFAHFVCSALKHFPKIKILYPTEEGNILAAIFRYKNTTYDGVFEVNRGVRNFGSIGQIVSLNNKTKGDSWGGDYCNNFAGAYDMTLMPPFLTKDSSFKLYSTDICTSAPIKFSSDIVFRGISGLRFTSDPLFLANKTVRPQNACFCPGSIGNFTRPGECPLEGTLDLSTCMNVPAILSYPHLLYASPYYQSLIDGLKPDPKLHSTFMDIEPTTGVPLQGSKRFQLNIIAKPNPAFRILKDTKFALVPILWFEERAELGKDQISMLRDQLLNVLHIADIVKWVLIACGICMALIGILMAILGVRKMHHHPD